MVSTTADPTSVTDAAQTPSVLVVLVVRNGLPRLRECLQSLAAQTYPRLAVLAVDNGSMDGSQEALEHALGAGRVLLLDDNRGFAGAVRAALDLPVAQEADHLLILHDDAALAPDAVARMVEAAISIPGVERVGVVGPKVVDWDDPRILREVGRSADRFGHPYSPLQEDEMDQGQFDRVLEVFFVSSCVMLVSREAWRRTGAFDERYRSHGDDLDFCWRARIAGFRVLMTPLAQARHRGAASRGERREDGHRERGSRYYAERAALGSMLKDYGFLTLLWLLPLHLVLGATRLIGLALSRRFEDAYELLSAWTWNIVHLPGTLRRRVRAQSVRSVRDGSLHRFMRGAFHIPKWVEQAEQIFEEQIEEDRERVRLRTRAASLAGEHPVLVAWALAALVAALAYRNLVGPEPLTGGALTAFPAHVKDLFAELVSGVRTTALGGAQSASPALGVLGAASWLGFGSPSVAQKAILALLPAIAAVTMYRAAWRQTGQRVAAVVAGVAYTLSAVVLWAFSQGRLGLLAALAVVPVVLDRLDSSFAAEAPTRPLRFVVGFGAALAIGVAFLPGVLPALGLLAVVSFLLGRRRGRGLLLAMAATATGAALVFPILPSILRQPGAELSSTIGTADFSMLARLAPGYAPGAWPAAWFLPAAAAIAFAVVGSEHRGRAWRAALVAVAGIFLAWASSAGWLPTAFTNAPAYLAAAAAAEAAIVAYGSATIAERLGREAFGLRQVAAFALAAVLGVGFAAQALGAAFGDWGTGPHHNEPAWPVVASDGSDFRVLWLGGPSGDPFPAPGGDPTGIVEAGGASVRYSITHGDGATALDIGRGEDGPGYAYTVRALQELVCGDTRHAGALLSVLGVRYLVAGEGDLPGVVSVRLDEQIDLDLVPAGGLVIYRNAESVPPAALVSSKSFQQAARGTDLGSISEMPSAEAQALPAIEGGWEVPPGAAGYAYIADQYADGWAARGPDRVSGPALDGEEAFGWAMGFPGVTDTAITYGRQWIRTAEIWGLGLLWLAALWVTRKQVSR